MPKVFFDITKTHGTDYVSAMNIQNLINKTGREEWKKYYYFPYEASELLEFIYINKKDRIQTDNDRIYTINALNFLHLSKEDTSLRHLAIDIEEWETQCLTRLLQDESVSAENLDFMATIRNPEVKNILQFHVTHRTLDPLVLQNHYRYNMQYPINQKNKYRAAKLLNATICALRSNSLSSEEHMYDVFFTDKTGTPNKIVTLFCPYHNPMTENNQYCFGYEEEFQDIYRSSTQKEDRKMFCVNTFDGSLYTLFLKYSEQIQGIHNNIALSYVSNYVTHYHGSYTDHTITPQWHILFLNEGTRIDIDQVEEYVTQHPEQKEMVCSTLYTIIMQDKEIQQHIKYNPIRNKYNAIQDLNHYLETQLLFQGYVSYISTHNNKNQTYTTISLSLETKIKCGTEGLFLHKKGDNKSTQLFGCNNKEIFFCAGSIIVIDKKGTLSFFQPPQHKTVEQVLAERNFIFLKKLLLFCMAMIASRFSVDPICASMKFLNKKINSLSYKIKIPLSIITIYILICSEKILLEFLMEKYYFQSRQKNFTNIWNLFHGDETNFLPTFEHFKTAFSTYYNSLSTTQKCFINAPHCSRCGCTPLFATIVAAKGATQMGKFTKKQILKRFKQIALYLASNNFHLDYRVSLDTYFKSPYHIKKSYYGGWHDVGTQELDFLETCKELFGKDNDDYENFKEKIEHSVDNIDCNKQMHTCGYQGGKLGYYW